MRRWALPEELRISNLDENLEHCDSSAPLLSSEGGLLALGQRNFRFVMVGEGSEKEWLRKNLHFCELPGTLHGAALAEAFANMDVFVFPSRTDTFGLVLLEAMASGVPVVVSPETAVRVDVRHAETGLYAEDVNSFTQSVLSLMKSEALRHEMSCVAHRFASSKNWCGVFDRLYQTYEMGLEEIGCAGPQAETLIAPTLR